MKVLILTLTAGEGHNSIGKAISTRLNSLNIENKTIDILKSHKVKQFYVNDMYIFACKRCKWLLTGGYHILQKRNPMKRQNTPVSQILIGVKKNIFKQIDEYNPDVVFCTHIYDARLIGDYKKLNPTKNIKSISILCDFTVHPFWETVTDLDYLLTPCSDFNDLLIFKGYRKEQLIDTGIPVDPKFSIENSKTEARKYLGLDESKTTLMVMNGGFGVSNNAKLIKDLASIPLDYQIVLVNGRNEKSKTEIDQLLSSGKIKNKVLNIGYSTEIDKLMDASDCMLCKTGGVSISESLNKKLPMIIVHNPPAQENDNMKFLLKKQMAVYVDKPKNFKKILENFLTDASLRSSIKENLQKLRKPNAAVDAVDFMLSISK